MADPVTVKTRLDRLAAHYAVFEPDQVLTHHQLNSVADYLDEQGALTRVDGLGVGIVAGLHVAARGDALALGRGLGLTTDGDLLRVSADRVYDQFRPYDDSAPRYAPFFGGANGAMAEMVELVAKGESDVQARPLADLAGWRDRVVVLLAECAENDPDLCTGADCDNLGRDALLRQRVLLMKAEDAKAMTGALPTLTSPADRAAQLPRVAAARPAFGADLANTAQFTARLADAAAQTVADFKRAIALVPRVLADVADELFGADPTPGWIAALDRHAASSRAAPAAALAWYQATKDLAETWNAMREALFDDDSVAVPDLGAFRKHLLLGIPSAPRTLRTGLYPSPLVAGTRQHRAHATFLLWKLQVLLDAFAVPADRRVQVTPSFGEAAPLEQRAIPWYYAQRSAAPVHVGWSYRLAARGGAADNRGYRAAEWQGDTNPLAGQLAAHDFLRIEGHLGQPVAAVAKQLEALAAAHNLPFAVRAVLLHNQRRFIAVRPPIRYSDLHRFHHVLRKDLQSDLVRSQSFAGALRQQVEEASSKGEIPPRVAGAENGAVASERHAAIGAAAGEAVKAFAKTSYRAFRAETAWKPQFDAVTVNAASFKQSFGNVLRTDVSTAFDHVVNNPRRQWLEWLDVLIDRKDEKADERLLFANFIRQHPGVDALGGVWRGGTFVLIYDDSGNVVADLTLPYRIADEDEDDDEPDLPVAPLPPLVGGIRLVKPLDLVAANIKTDLLAEVNVQREWSKNFSETIVKLGAAINPTKGTLGGATAGVDNLRSGALATYTRRAAYQQQEIAYLRERIVDPATSDADRKALTTQLGEAEAALGKTVEDGTRFIVANQVDTASGADGALALTTFSQSASAINNTTVRTELATNLTKLESEARLGNALPQANAVGNLRIVTGFGR
ncbi:MAG TPA: hypothetical protein VFQ20_01360 [Burkholderiaceae bacterium]|nr:hypothetical protein [Burkholderiaceae bacterium]